MRGGKPTTDRPPRSPAAEPTTARPVRMAEMLVPTRRRTPTATVEPGHPAPRLLASRPASNCAFLPDVAPVPVDPARDRFAARTPPATCAHRQIGAEELLAQRGQQLAVDSPAVLEPHFQFCRMNVDVDQIRGHLQPEESDRRAAGQQQAAVGFAQRMLQRAIADVPAVQEQVLHAVVAPAVVRIRHVSGQADLAVVAGPTESAWPISPPKNVTMRSRQLSTAGRS